MGLKRPVASGTRAMLVALRASFAAPLRLYLEPVVQGLASERNEGVGVPGEAGPRLWARVTLKAGAFASKAERVDPDRISAGCARRARM